MSRVQGVDEITSLIYETNVSTGVARLCIILDLNIPVTDEVLLILWKH